MARECHAEKRLVSTIRPMLIPASPCGLNPGYDNTGYDLHRLSYPGLSEAMPGTHVELPRADEFRQRLADPLRAPQHRCRHTQSLRSRKRGDVTAGFLDQKQSGQRIPSVERQLDEAVEAARGDMRELQRAGPHVASRDAGVHQRVTQRENTRLGAAVVVADTDECVGERVAGARVQRRIVARALAPRSVAAAGVKQLVGLGI